MTDLIISDSLVIPCTDKRARDALRGVPVLRKHGGNTGTKANKGKFYLDIVAAFDTETSTIELPDGPQAFTYVWQLQLGPELTIIGRTWSEFLDLMQTYRDYMPTGSRLCVWVHNLSFDFQFMQGVYPFKPSEVFCIDSRKVLKCEMYGCIEFRCSYLHSNMGLALFADKMQTKHRKLVGDLDYSIVRYPWTPLDPKTELPYMVNDVVCLVEAITNEMEHDGDNLYTIPKTSTGYVRRDVKKAMRRVRRGYVQELQPDYECYKALREAFRGGNCHANRYYAGELQHDVKSVDESSAYPYVIVCCKYPIGNFFYQGEATLEDLEDIMVRRGKAVLARVSFSNIRLRDKFNGCPYLTIDKSRHLQGFTADNGRILEADYLETTVTDIDLKIILKQYDFDDFYSFNTWFTRYGPLPQCLKDTVLEYYTLKTRLKGVEGKEVLYTKSKNKLNSIYGMMAQNPVKQTIDFIDGEYIEREEDEAHILEVYGKRAFLTYQWGVWTTANARAALQEGIDAAGDQFIYTDTDSVKFFPDEDIMQRFAKINRQRMQLAQKNGAFSYDPAGNIHYMGVFEDDGDYSEFKTLGAKKYVVRSPRSGKIMATIAGATKVKAGPELEKHGGVDAFREGFIFREAGGTDLIYNDLKEPIIIEAEGRELRITSNVVIKESTYTVGLTADYLRLLDYSRKVFLHDFHLHGIM